MLVNATGSPCTRDAVVVVPGIMGSELAGADGTVLWGLADPGWYVSAWTSGRSLRELRLTDDERAGRYGRVRATRLLRFPAFMPMLAGLSPYAGLLAAVRSVAGDACAVREFPYDWRLPVAHNAALLVEAATRHLDDWAASDEHLALRRRDPDGDRDPRLVFVAHSMGGLLVRDACRDNGVAGRVRATITLGTPFFGAPKAVVLMSSGRGVPMPRSRVRELAGILPGFHDLLPSYRCVHDGVGVRRLTPSDVAGLGGDGELAAASVAWQKSVADAVLPGLVQIVGAHQPTVQAVRIADGAATGLRFTYRPGGGGGGGFQEVDLGGDATVPRESAQLPNLGATPLAQSHGALPADGAAQLIVRDALTDRRTGPWQGVGDIGLDLPDVVEAGRPYPITVVGAGQPTDVTCTVVDVGTGLRVDTPPVGREGGALVCRAAPLPPGLYRVSVDSGGSTPVTEMIMSYGVDR